MVVFPNCKINLGLHVTRKRPDGFHDLETVFYPIDLKEVLEIIGNEQVSMQITGLPVEGNIDNNLCIKAYRLLKNDFPDLGPVKMHLHKVVPMGAGLGGGSADGAFMLIVLNKFFQLQLSENQLLQYALQLGSDCPFFIINKPCFATGRGEKLDPVSIDLSNYTMVLINPKIHVSTKDAFANLTPATPEKNLQEIIKQPIATWKDELRNDFESSIFPLHPAIKEVKKRLYSLGAVYAAMSGSGSSVFGIFERTSKINLSFPAHYTCITIP